MDCRFAARIPKKLGVTAQARRKKENVNVTIPLTNQLAYLCLALAYPRIALFPASRCLTTMMDLESAVIHHADHRSWFSGSVSNDAQLT
jgi:hypothetical protein